MSYNRGKIKVQSTAKKQSKNTAWNKDMPWSLAGQWKYPGQVTKVPSGDITMAGVNYPVFGVDDLGNEQMMMPGGEYQFPGNVVTEYPMMQSGGGHTVIPRQGVRENPDGTHSTHLMRREFIPNKGWVAFPSLFQNKDNSWVDMSKGDDWVANYEEALRRGEVYDFGEDEKAAIDFADKGSWKKQYGGLSKAQPGKNVTYNTPEYNQAYDQGTVTRYDPATGVYQAPDLPEFTITEDDPRIANAVRGAQSEFLQTAPEAFSAPQKQMVEWMTGTQQTPSEAWPTGHWASDFALDAVTDPMNLIGAGAASKALRMGNVARRIPKGSLLRDNASAYMKQRKLFPGSSANIRPWDVFDTDKVTNKVNKLIDEQSTLTRGTSFDRSKIPAQDFIDAHGIHPDELTDDEIIDIFLTKPGGGGGMVYGSPKSRLYVSNSLPTSEGYTYGEGVKGVLKHDYGISESLSNADKLSALRSKGVKYSDDIELPKEHLDQFKTDAKTTLENDKTFLGGRMKDHQQYITDAKKRLKTGNYDRTKEGKQQLKNIIKSKKREIKYTKNQLKRYDKKAKLIDSKSAFSNKDIITVLGDQAHADIIKQKGIDFLEHDVDYASGNRYLHRTYVNPKFNVAKKIPVGHGDDTISRGHFGVRSEGMATPINNLTSRQLVSNTLDSVHGQGPMRRLSSKVPVELKLGLPFVPVGAGYGAWQNQMQREEAARNGVLEQQYGGNAPQYYNDMNYYDDNMNYFGRGGQPCFDCGGKVHYDNGGSTAPQNTTIDSIGNKRIKLLENKLTQNTMDFFSKQYQQQLQQQMDNYFAEGGRPKPVYDPNMSYADMYDERQAEAESNKYGALGNFIDAVGVSAGKANAKRAAENAQLQQQPGMNRINPLSVNTETFATDAGYGYEPQLAIPEGGYQGVGEYAYGGGLRQFVKGGEDDEEQKEVERGYWLKKLRHWWDSDRPDPTLMGDTDWGRGLTNMYETYLGDDEIQGKQSGAQGYDWRSGQNPFINPIVGRSSSGLPDISQAELNKLIAEQKKKTNRIDPLDVKKDDKKDVVIPKEPAKKPNYKETKEGEADEDSTTMGGREDYYRTTGSGPYAGLRKQKFKMVYTDPVTGKKVRIKNKNLYDAYGNPTGSGMRGYAGPRNIRIKNKDFTIINGQMIPNNRNVSANSGDMERVAPIQADLSGYGEPRNIHGAPDPTRVQYGDGYQQPGTFKRTATDMPPMSSDDARAYDKRMDQAKLLQMAQDYQATLPEQAYGGESYFPQPYPGGMQPNGQGAYFFQDGGGFNFEGDPNDPMYNYGFNQDMTSASTGNDPYAIDVDKMKYSDTAKGNGFMDAMGTYGNMIDPGLNLIASKFEEAKLLSPEERQAKKSTEATVASIEDQKHGTWYNGQIDPFNRTPTQFGANARYGGDMKKYQAAGVIPVDNTRVAPPHIPAGTIEEQMAAAALRTQQLEELKNPYTAIATPDHSSPFVNDSIRFFPGQSGSQGSPYIRDLGNLVGVSHYSSNDYLDMVNNGNARMYQDSSRVNANPSYMPNKQYGGQQQYEDGGEYDLTPEEIAYIESMGGTVQYV